MHECEYHHKKPTFVINALFECLLFSYIEEVWVNITVIQITALKENCRILALLQQFTFLVTRCFCVHLVFCLEFRASVSRPWCRWISVSLHLLALDCIVVTVLFVCVEKVYFNSYVWGYVVVLLYVRVMHFQCFSFTLFIMLSCIIHYYQTFYVVVRKTTIYHGSPHFFSRYWVPFYFVCRPFLIWKKSVFKGLHYQRWSLVESLFMLT